MDTLVKDLSSVDSKTRLAAIEKVVAKLQHRSWFRDSQNDLKVKLMSSSINIVRDANPKVATVGLECLQLLIRNYPTDFHPLANMSFELVLTKLGDSKGPIRAQALNVMTQLVPAMGAVIGLDRLATNMGHKNQRVRENLLWAVSRLHESLAEELRAVPKVCPAVAVLLGDQFPTIRSQALGVLLQLGAVYGHGMLGLLAASGVCLKPAALRQL
eukprot:CAMPEP_0173312684 /NCGR_PEP_ID=MMETSP1143-20121109/24293_1 /TAXON_ID=483371 /ORGANISM="non described non described, Strain CCMP2298" /LENGTH=213 /DNA_ID=CAMNT_0014254955 /DNA_START=36 /DNA_END=674 /DNA_ORIENTATION=+